MRTAARKNIIHEATYSFSNALLFFISFALVSCAQPDWSQAACLLAAACGYALFWKSLAFYESVWLRFCGATLWFGGIQFIHLSWFTADRYVGSYIIFFLIGLALVLGTFFAFFSLCILSFKNIKGWMVIGLSGLWVLFEWGRLFVLSGFSWNPMGLAIGSNLIGMQFSALGGTLGLTFWLLITNLFAYKFFQKFSKKNLIFWILAVIIPYAFGFCHFFFHKYQMVKQESGSLNAILVQTALYPEQKISLNNSLPLTPYEQWERILDLLAPFASKGADLIVLSEAVVPYGTHLPIYSAATIAQIFNQKWGSNFISSEHRVGNSFWVQSIANIFQSDVIIGLEDYQFSEEKAEAYNAAFLFQPFKEQHERYKKRILVPMGEYIPFNWCKKILSKYGIEDSFTAGKEATVLKGAKASYGVSICYEETYGHLQREERLKDATLFVNLTNDVWYPHSRLPVVHFFHGRLRAIEAGIPLVRCCNTGVTCGINSLGEVIDIAEYETKSKEALPEALSLSLPLYRYRTLYTLIGDLPLILIAFLGGSSLSIPFFKRRLKSK